MTYDEFYSIVQPYTMTSTERIKELYNTLEYIRQRNIEGDLIECGVWMGGNILGMAEYCHRYGMNKKIWLYDTFQGMTEPEERDIEIHNNKPAKDILEEVKCEASIDRVREVIGRSKYPKDRFYFVIGDVVQSLEVKENIPEQISLLRLDTDWYKSTKKELEVLYPKLVNNGVLIVDDYGHWQGAKEAVEEYFKQGFEHRQIDYTGVIHVKKICNQQTTKRE